MLIFGFDALRQNPEGFAAILAAYVVAVVTGIAFHEFSHALTALELGDGTAARQGRVSLNPFRHLDPLGTALLFFVGFGWGKPTPVSPGNLRYGHRIGSAIVSAAGPLSNLVFALIAAFAIRLGVMDYVNPYSLNVLRYAGPGDLFVSAVLSLNILLGVFNLIPIPPLDGFKVVQGIVPREVANVLDSLAPWGPGLLMLFFMLSLLTGGAINPIGDIMGPFVDHVAEALL